MKNVNYKQASMVIIGLLVTWQATNFSLNYRAILSSIIASGLAGANTAPKAQSQTVSEYINAIGIVIAAAISGYAALMASKAERNSRPVANGFTDYVITDLREIRRLLLDHIISHNGQDERVTQGISDEIDCD